MKKRKEKDATEIRRTLNPLKPFHSLGSGTSHSPLIRSILTSHPNTGVLHKGQVDDLPFRRSQGSIHALWKMWQHGKVVMVCPCLGSSKQMLQKCEEGGGDEVALSDDACADVGNDAADGDMR
uniref:Uncharacterized protein n=1 Tax=Polytomella parva TaxID=51329 RepID=A0A7S0V6V5_9CHLO|mmetsp:Transcript_31584/g.57383  ORF Transcript_31584/g.57383 Transcript_31584/m.57383 type:complete len:123 (+) Transcript_31584:224-592(+)